jgi:hypothetical protein
VYEYQKRGAERVDSHEKTDIRDFVPNSTCSSGCLVFSLKGRKPRNDEVRCPAPKEPFDQFLLNEGIYPPMNAHCKTRRFSRKGRHQKLCAKRADSHEMTDIRNFVQNAPILMKGRASETWGKTARFSQSLEDARSPLEDLPLLAHGLLTPPVGSDCRCA